MTDLIDHVQGAVGIRASPGLVMLHQRARDEMQRV